MATTIAVNLPVGYRFSPTDEELVRHYLRRKLDGNNLGDECFIGEMDVYAKEPWLLPHVNSPHLKENNWYYFVKRVRAAGTNGNGKRPRRTIEGDLNSSWRASVGEKKIYSWNGQVVGYKKILSFVTNKKRMNGERTSGTKTDWVMTEYSLSLDSFQEWVICHIRYNGKGKFVWATDPEVLPTNETCSEQHPNDTRTRFSNFYNGVLVDGEAVAALEPDEAQFANNLAIMLSERDSDLSFSTESSYLPGSEEIGLKPEEKQFADALALMLSEDSTGGVGVADQSFSAGALHQPTTTSQNLGTAYGLEQEYIIGEFMREVVNDKDGIPFEDINKWLNS